MSELDGRTMYRIVITIEEFEIVNGTQQTPETVSSIPAQYADIGLLEFNSFDKAKSAQIKLSGIKMEEIPEHEDR